MIAVPLLKDNELVGAIFIYRQEVRPFTYTLQSPKMMRAPLGLSIAKQDRTHVRCLEQRHGRLWPAHQLGADCLRIGPGERGREHSVKKSEPQKPAAQEEV